MPLGLLLPGFEQNLGFFPACVLFVGKGLGHIRSAGKTICRREEFLKILSLPFLRGYKTRCDLETKTPFLNPSSSVPTPPPATIAPRPLALRCSPGKDGLQSRTHCSVLPSSETHCLISIPQSYLFARGTGTGTTGSTGWPHL
jgi:hypothetical protein